MRTVLTWWRARWCRWFHHRLLVCTEARIYTRCDTCGLESEGITLGQVPHRVTDAELEAWHRRIDSKCGEIDAAINRKGGAR